MILFRFIRMLLLSFFCPRNVTWCDIMRKGHELEAPLSRATEEGFRFPLAHLTPPAASWRRPEWTPAAAAACGRGSCLRAPPPPPPRPPALPPGRTPLPPPPRCLLLRAEASIRLRGPFQRAERRRTSPPGQPLLLLGIRLLQADL